MNAGNRGLPAGVLTLKAQVYTQVGQCKSHQYFCGEKPGWIIIDGQMAAATGQIMIQVIGRDAAANPCDAASGRFARAGDCEGSGCCIDRYFGQ